MSKKINVSNSHPVGLASHRDKGVFLVAEKNLKKYFRSETRRKQSKTKQKVKSYKAKQNVAKSIHGNMFT